MLFEHSLLVNLCSHQTDKTKSAAAKQMPTLQTNKFSRTEPTLTDWPMARQGDYPPAIRADGKQQRQSILGCASQLTID